MQLTTSPQNLPRQKMAVDGRFQDIISSQFQEFYKVIYHSAKAATRVSEQNAMSTVQALSQKICALIEAQDLDLRRLGSLNIEIEHQNRYLKAILADEILLNTDWEGKKYWGHFLVETTLFQTSCAGDKVFDDIERLLEKQDAALKPCALLYLYVLSLGFEGRFRDTPKRNQISQYRKQLYQFVYQRKADIEGRITPLSEQAYLSTLSNFPKSPKSKWSRNNILFLLVIFILLTISEFVWLLETWPIRKTLNNLSYEVKENTWVG